MTEELDNVLAIARFFFSGVKKGKKMQLIKIMIYRRYANDSGGFCFASTADNYTVPRCNLSIAFMN
jgi:hypothetical protein